MQQTQHDPQQEQTGQTGSAGTSGQTSQMNPQGSQTSQQGSQMSQQGSQMGQQGGGMTSQGGQMAGRAGHMGSQGATQTTGQSQGSVQGTGFALQDVETPEQREAVYQIMRAIQTCGWCAEQCVQEADPMMIECIRLCEDVAELGETALAMIPRQSQHAQTVVQAFQQAAQACAQECSQHMDSHCQECAQVLDNASYAVQQYTAPMGQQGGQATTPSM